VFHFRCVSVVHGIGITSGSRSYITIQTSNDSDDSHLHLLVDSHKLSCADRHPQFVRAIPSVRPSVTRVPDQSKKVEVMIMHFSPHSSPIPLVFAGYVSSRNSDGFPRAGASNKGGVGQTGCFLAYMRQCLENGIRDTSKVSNDY